MRFFPGGPWRFEDRFGVQWLITRTSPSDQKPGASSSRNFSFVQGLVYNAFNSTGATDDVMATVLLAVYDALTHRQLARELTRPTDDPRRILRNFDTELRQTLVHALADDRIRIERAPQRPWPFPDRPSDPVPDFVPPPPSSAPDTTTFIAIRLVNQNGDPVSNRPYRIVLPDGSVNDGLLDSLGSARISDVSPGGLCRISCPFAQPHSNLSHQVLPGEHISGIAYAYGFEDYTVVWNDPNNADLASLRTNPHELVPNDAIYIPPLADGTVTRPTGAVHTFVIQQSPLELRVKLLGLDMTALANAACILDDADLSADGDGILSSPFSKIAQASFLQVTGLGLALQVGRLAPIDDDSDAGWKARLYNLGFLWDCTASDDDDEMVIALQDFQAQYQLQTTGQFDDATKAQLAQAYGC